MKRPLLNTLLLAITLLISSKLQSATLYSITSSNWESPSTWSKQGVDEKPCNCTPTTHDIIIISHNITFSSGIKIGQGGSPDSVRINAAATLTSTTADLSVTSTGNLNVIGSLIARDIVFFNGSNIDVTQEGTLLATRNLFNRNNSKQVRVAGAIRVDGNFDAGNGSMIIGSGSLYVQGTSTFQGTGIAFGCQGDCCPAGTDCTFTLNALPVSWLGVQVKADGPSNTIHWQTASEENNNYFTLERSINGAVFSPIGKRQGSGTKLTKSEYSFRDSFPPSGKVYYRIRQTDYNGEYAYSPVVSFRNSNAALNSSVEIFPNPCAEGQSITCKASWIQPDTEYSVTATDAQGRQVSENRIMAASAGYITIPSGFLERTPAGIYYLRLSSGSMFSTARFLVY